MYALVLYLFALFPQEHKFVLDDKILARGLTKQECLLLKESKKRSVGVEKDYMLIVHKDKKTGKERRVFMRLACLKASRYYVEKNS